jgi:hypothetical protein
MPVNFATVEPSTEDAIINIDVCNSGKAFLSGCGMPATIQVEAVNLFPIVADFDRPVSAFMCLSVAPAIADPPPRRSLSTF